MVEPFQAVGGEEEVFKYSLFLVLFNRLSSCIIAVCMLAVSHAEQAPQALLLMLHCHE